MDSLEQKYFPIDEEVSNLNNDNQTQEIFVFRHGVGKFFFLPQWARLGQVGMAKNFIACESQRKITFFVFLQCREVKMDYIEKKTDFCVITLIAKNEVSPV